MAGDSDEAESMLDSSPVGGVEGADIIDRLYSMMLKMFSGFLLEQMIVVTPAAVAISAAMSFVSIPPVPSFDPKVLVLTGKKT